MSAIEPDPRCTRLEVSQEMTMENPSCSSFCETMECQTSTKRLHNYFRGQGKRRPDDETRMLSMSTLSQRPKSRRLRIDRPDKRPSGGEHKSFTKTASVSRSSIVTCLQHSHQRQLNRDKRLQNMLQYEEAGRKVQSRHNRSSQLIISPNLYKCSFERHSEHQTPGLRGRLDCL